MTFVDNNQYDSIFVKHRRRYSMHKNVQLILKSYLPVVYGTTLSEPRNQQKLELHD
jgi:hypothetical protein